MVEYSAASSQPDRSLSAPANLPIVFVAHSSNASAPFPSLSSLAKALRREASSSSRSIAPVLVLVRTGESLLLAALGAGFGRYRELRCAAGPVLRLLRAAPKAIAKSEPRGPARRGKLRSGAGNRPQPPPENATRRTPFNIRRFGMAKLASGTDGVNRAEARLARNAETPPSHARDQAPQAPTACFE